VAIKGDSEVGGLGTRLEDVETAGDLEGSHLVGGAAQPARVVVVGAAAARRRSDELAPRTTSTVALHPSHS
jgi:hypothetical protein